MVRDDDGSGLRRGLGLSKGGLGREHGVGGVVVGDDVAQSYWAGLGAGCGLDGGGRIDWKMSEGEHGWDFGDGAQVLARMGGDAKEGGAGLLWLRW
ncbi:hypothetical protein M0R45_036638 [Rubus argutus]|uniref:Uncharacterized protein n=1 Tax=Rubus argutus TaxID=59490 RepID=A0AAW1VXL6_RUBAR